MNGPAALRAVLAVPVEPNADQGRQWLLEELAKAPYRAAQPSPLDVAARAVWDWLRSLFTGGNATLGALLPLLLLLLVVAALVAALLIYGLPRLNRRSGPVGSLFGQEDGRSDDALRRAARAAADAGNYALAIQERFRALARDLAERSIVSVSPGTTAHGFAARAAVAFPDFAARFDAAAAGFDTVRYLGGKGTAAGYRQLAELDDDLRRAPTVGTASSSTASSSTASSSTASSGTASSGTASPTPRGARG